MLIHVGFPKAGSTWLQEGVFTGERAGFWAPWILEQKREFLQSNPYRFSPERARAVFEPGIAEAHRRGLVPVITDEWLTGNQVTGDYRGKHIADAMHATFPDARVLLVIREQRAMLVSSYREYVACGGLLSFDEFLGFGAVIEGFDAHCRLDHLEYDLPIGYYQKLFGPEGVMVEPFERMISAPVDFYRRLSEFSGAKGTYVPPRDARNVGLRGTALVARRLLNALDRPFAWHFERAGARRRLVERATSLLGQLSPGSLDARFEVELEARLDAHVREVYAASNRRTSALLGVDLGALGYTT